MTSQYFYDKLPSIKPGQKVLIKADISERTPNTNIEMTLFAGKVMTVKMGISGFGRIGRADSCLRWSAWRGPLALRRAQVVDLTQKTAIRHP